MNRTISLAIASLVVALDADISFAGWGKSAFILERSSEANLRVSALIFADFRSATFFSKLSSGMYVSKNSLTSVTGVRAFTLPMNNFSFSICNVYYTR